ncbi:hypothetical protein RhiJN_22431 [Ceratobasidium sp. AG-Ba]|nr:hypothetical protein RhiJN_22431 [Ceratobasidium sp. AG-Ba]
MGAAGGVFLCYGDFHRGTIVASSGKSGTAQVITMLVVEIFSLVRAILIRRKSRRAERDLVLNDAPSPLHTLTIPPPTRLSIILRVLRIIGSGLIIAFPSSFGVRPIPRAMIGIVASAVWGIGVVWAFTCVAWGLIKLSIAGRRKGRGHGQAW